MVFENMVYIYILNVPEMCLLLVWCSKSNLYSYYISQFVDSYSWYLFIASIILFQMISCLKGNAFIICIVFRVFKHLVCDCIRFLRMRLLHINCASICWYYFYEKNFAIYKNIILWYPHNAKIKLEVMR